MEVQGIKALCEVFGCSHQAIAEWQQQGMPVLSRGGPNTPSVFQTVDVHAWLVDRAVAKASGGESPRDRVFRLQGDALELEMAEKRGRLIPADAVEPLWSSAVVAAREMLLGERRRLAALLDGVNDRQQREALIGQVHEAYLRKLAAWRAANDDDDAAADAVGAG